MKKNGKRIAALAGVVAIVIFIVAYIISAFRTGADSQHTFLMMFFCIVALPIMAWIILFCIKKMKQKPYEGLDDSEEEE